MDNNYRHEMRDPIYGFIPYNDWEKKIIDHPVFQRLRRTKQLGLTDYVYPSGGHTRFEHSLGAMHYSTLMFNSIVNKKTNTDTLEKYLKYKESGLEAARQIMRFAALLHDVGHPPFSHSSEKLLPQNPATKQLYKHEDYSVAIIKKIFKEIVEEDDNNVNHNIDIEDVVKLISNDSAGKNISESFKGKIFWKLLITSELDADRGDYLLRDSHHLGVKYGLYDYSRLINTLAIGIDDDNDVILGISEDGWHTAESLLIARYNIFTQVNFHKTRRAFDYHFRKAIKAADIEFPPPDKLDDYLNIDEIYVSNKIKENKTKDWDLITSRKQIREVFVSYEIPKAEDLQNIEKIKDALDHKGIMYHEDIASEPLYNEGGGKEIMIIPSDKRESKKKIWPLSEYSNIIKNMKPIKIIRIYVNLDDKKKAEGIVDGIITS